jgi:hypothetical protein
VDKQAKHDLKWVCIWTATTLLFAVLTHFSHSAWWTSAALITGAFLYFYSVASFTAWRDRVAEAKRR